MLKNPINLETKNKDTFRCPALPPNNAHSNVNSLHWQSFGLNIWATRKDSIVEAVTAFVKRGRMGKKRKEFAGNSPSSLFLIVDSVFTTYGGSFGNSMVQYMGIASTNGKGFANGAVHFRHNSGYANFGMLDGSASSMNFKAAYFRSDVTFGVMPDSQILKQPFKE